MTLLMIVCPECGQFVEVDEMARESAPLLTYSRHWVPIVPRVIKEYGCHRETSQVICPSSHTRIKPCQA